jgi:hypothetical protein
MTDGNATLSPLVGSSGGSITIGPYGVMAE